MNITKSRSESFCFFRGSVLSSVIGRKREREGERDIESDRASERYRGTEAWIDRLLGVLKTDDPSINPDLQVGVRVLRPDRLL